MQTNTVIVTKNNIKPIQCICLNISNTDAEPPEDNTTHINYDTLTTPEKLQFDECMAMIESKI